MLGYPARAEQTLLPASFGRGWQKGPAAAATTTAAAGAAATAAATAAAGAAAVAAARLSAAPGTKLAESLRINP